MHWSDKYALKSFHHAGGPLEMLPYKIVNNNKIVVCLACVQYYLHTILLWPVYYGNWPCHLKNDKKWCIWFLHFCNFLWLSVFVLFLQISYIYIYILKFGCTSIYIYIEIRYRETCSPEVSVSSTMVTNSLREMAI